MVKVRAFIGFDFFAAANLFHELRNGPRPAGIYTFNSSVKIVYPNGDVLLFAGANSITDPRTQIEHFDFERLAGQKLDEIVLSPSVPVNVEPLLRTYLAEGGTIRVGVPTL